MKFLKIIVSILVLLNFCNLSFPKAEAKQIPLQSASMPAFEAVDVKMGQVLIQVAAYYEDRSESNIIYAAECWKKQRGNKNVFVYFVNDPSYRIDNRREEEHKVIAFYKYFNGDSQLWFFYPDGNIKQNMRI